MKFSALLPEVWRLFKVLGEIVVNPYAYITAKVNKMEEGFSHLNN